MRPRPSRSPEAQPIAATLPSLELDPRALYEAEEPFVRRVVVRLAGLDADVDDLVHDVFEVAVRRARSFEGRSAPRTWLYGIAIRVVARWRRRRRLRRFFSLSDAPEPTEPTTPADLFECREKAELVYRVLDAMAEKKRTVFVLHEMEGLSGEDIAQSVGCPLKTVWTRLFHARREFTRQISTWQDEPS